MTYERLKALFWPHVAGPFAVMVAVDYLTLVSGFVKVFAAAYLMLQLLAYLVGFVAKGLTAAGRDVDLSRYQAARFFPLLAAGAASFDYLMTETPRE